MRPSMFVSGRNCFDSAAVMIVPPPPVERLSSPSITSAPGAQSAPSALATPGTAPTFATSESLRGAAALNWLVKAAFGATSTSTFV